MLQISGDEYELKIIYNALCESKFNLIGCEPGCREDDILCKECVKDYIENGIKWIKLDNAGIRKNKDGNWVENEGEEYHWN